PRKLPAQSEKVMIQQLQRDVAQVDEKLRQFKEAQDKKSAELEALLKQSLKSNAKLTAEMGSLHQTLTSAIADQQSKLVQPINAVGHKVDELATALSAIETRMDSINRRMTANDGKLVEILNNLKTLNAPPPPPPTANTGGGGTAPTAGASADVVFQN